MIKYEINCQVGDFIRYYSSIDGAAISKHDRLPVDLIVDVNINDDSSRHFIIITDGIVNKFNYVNHIDLPDDFDHMAIVKRLKVCKSKKYAICISYTQSQVSDRMTDCIIDIYMEDTKKLDKIYNEIPNDIDFR